MSSATCRSRVIRSTRWSSPSAGGDEGAGGAPRRRDHRSLKQGILPVLQAAHIRPVTAEGLHRVDNGLLFRSDVHTLFDTGSTITPDYRFRVSRRLRDDFHNGEYYLTLDQREIWVPPRPTGRPDRAALEWHSDTVFRA